MQQLEAFLLIEQFCLTCKQTLLSTAFSTEADTRGHFNLAVILVHFEADTGGQLNLAVTLAHREDNTRGHINLVKTEKGHIFKDTKVSILLH